MASMFPRPSLPVASLFRVRASTRRFPLGPFCRLVLPFGSSPASFIPFRRQCPHSPAGVHVLSSGGPETPLYGEPNHALQRTEAGDGLFLAIHVLFRQPLSLSLSSLGPATLPLGCFEGMSVPVPPQSSVFPFVLSARPSFAASQSLRSSIPGGSALIPPPEFPSIAPAVQRRSVGGRPNHALQRTEAGRRGFPRFHVLRGQPLSLSLSSLGGYASSCPSVP